MRSLRKVKWRDKDGDGRKKKVLLLVILIAMNSIQLTEPIFLEATATLNNFEVTAQPSKPATIVIVIWLTVNFDYKVNCVDIPPKFEVISKQGTSTLFKEIGILAGVDSFIHLVINVNYTKDLGELDKLCALPNKVMSEVTFTKWSVDDKGKTFVKVKKDRTYMKNMAMALYNRCFSIMNEFMEKKEALTTSYQLYSNTKPLPLPPYRHQLKNAKFENGAILAQTSFPRPPSIEITTPGGPTTTMSAKDIINKLKGKLFPKNISSHPAIRAQTSYNLTQYSIADIEKAMILDAAWRSSSIKKYQNSTVRAATLMELKLPYIFSLPNRYNLAWHDSHQFWAFYPNTVTENGVRKVNSYKKHLERMFILNYGKGEPWKDARPKREQPTYIADDDFPEELLFLIHNNLIEIRESRQIVVGLAIATILVSVTAIFTKEIVEDIIGGSGGHVAVLNTHEARLTIQDRSLKLINQTVSDLANVADLLNNEISELMILQQIDSTLSSVESDYHRIFRGMNSIIERRLSPDITKQESLQRALSQLREYALQHNYILGISSLQDIYNCEISQIWTNNQSHGILSLVLHVPIIRLDSQLKFYEIVNIPVAISEESDYMFLPNPKHSYLAVNSDETRYKILTKDEFDSCNKFGKTFFCPNSNIYNRKILNTCEVALYRNNVEAIKSTCTFLVKPKADHSTQLSANKFLLYFQNKESIRLKCFSIKTQRLTTQAKTIGPGLFEVNVPPSCSLVTSSYTCEGQLKFSAAMGSYEARIYPPIQLILDENQNFSDVNICKEAFKKLHDHLKKQKAKYLTGKGLHFKKWKFQDNIGFFGRIENIAVIGVAVVVAFCVLVVVCWLCKCIPAVQNKFPSRSERKYNQVILTHDRMLGEIGSLIQQGRSSAAEDFIDRNRITGRTQGISSAPTSPTPPRSRTPRTTSHVTTAETTF